MTEVTLRQLEYFVAVVDANSVTEASRRSKVSQATVSMAVAQLERSLGVELLIRQRAKGVAPTKAGREFARRARGILRDAVQLTSAASLEFSGVAGSLDVGCVSSLSPQLIPPLASHFSAEFPAVRFDYREGAADDVQRALGQGSVDVGLIFTRLADSRMTIHELAPVELRVMLASDHPLATRSHVSFREIEDEPAILIDLPPSNERSVEFMRAAGSVPQIRWTSANLATVASLVSHGLGYSLRYCLPGERAPIAEGVVEVPVANPLPPNSVSAIHPADVRPSASVRELISHLRRYLQPPR